MLTEKRIQMIDTFIHQEYSNKYVHGGKVLFFYMEGETELSVGNFHINQLEENLEAITRTIEQLKRDGCSDEKILNELREERDKILKDLNL